VRVPSTVIWSPAANTKAPHFRIPDRNRRGQFLIVCRNQGKLISNVPAAVSSPNSTPAILLEPWNSNFTSRIPSGSAHTDCRSDPFHTDTEDHLMASRFFISVVRGAGRGKKGILHA